jgi:hypothetical protein
MRNINVGMIFNWLQCLLAIRATCIKCIKLSNVILRNVYDPHHERKKKFGKFALHVMIFKTTQFSSPKRFVPVENRTKANLVCLYRQLLENLI